MNFKFLGYTNNIYIYTIYFDFTAISRNVIHFVIVVVLFPLGYIDTIYYFIIDYSFVSIHHLLNI